MNERHGRVDLAFGGAHASAVEDEERAPRRVDRELDSFAERLLARGRVSRAPREHLERQPCAGALRDRSPRDSGGLPGAGLSFRGVRRDIGHVGGAHQQRANLLVGGRRDAHQGVDEAAQVSQATALLEQPHESLEGLVERGVRAVRGEVVPCRRRLVARPLLSVADLGEQAGLAPNVRRGRELGSKTPHRFRKGPPRLGAEGRGDAGRSRRQRLRRLAERGLGHSRSRRGRPPLSRDKRNVVSAMHA